MSTIHEATKEKRVTMTNGVYDSYQLEQGLKPVYDMTIASSSFEYDANYNSGQTLCLILKGIDNDGDEQRVLYPCSPGWVPADGGARAVREDGAQNRTFNQSSGVGGLIAAALACGAPLRERGPATSAAVWLGMAFRFERKVLNEGTDYKTTRALPIAFLGVGQPGSAPPAASVPPAAAPAPGAPPVAPAAMAPGGIDKMTEMKLKAIAKRVATHDAFIEEGLALAENNPAVEAVLADPAWFEAARV